MKTWKSIILLLLLLTVRATADDGSNAVPFIYEAYWKLPPLTAEQAARIMAVAERCAPTNQRPWFVLVTDSGEWVDGTVYFTPDVRAGRILKGKMIFLHSIGMTHGVSPRLEVYEAIVPSGQKEYSPSLHDLPFAVKGSLSDQEVVEIVDVARRTIEANPGFPDQLVHRAPDLTTESGKWFAEALDQYRHAPICSICVTGEVIEVKTALTRRGLAGRGTWLRLGKKDGKWVVIDKGKWLS